MAGRLRLARKKWFAPSGVWDEWKRPDGKVFTVAILMTQPNELTRQVHDRMPVILRADAEVARLDPAIG